MDRPPSLEGGAAARCAVALLDGLATLGVECQLLCPQGQAPVLSPPGGLALEMVPIPDRKLAQIRRDRLIRPLGRLTRDPFAERLRALSEQADLVHFVEAEAAAAIDLVDRPALAQLHCLTRRDPRVWNPLRPQGRQSIDLLRGELRVRKRAHWLLVNSREVAATLGAASPNADVTVAPLALEPSHYLPRATLESSLVGLIGSAYWPPTQHAVERLLRSVWPRVLKRRPGARLLLAGEGMERLAFAHIPEPVGIEWRGRVPVATEFLRELSVLLYPLTRGSGAKVKVLEAMALGVPVVTTPEGAEGAAASEGVRIRIDDMQLADATISLLDDLALRRAVGADGLGSFQSHHTPAVAAQPVVELYERMLA
jgi:glycosyltransferase involved in cell wall biosynthesis